MKKIILFALSLSITACSTTGDNIDPYETTNRKTFEFNRKFDRAVMDPLANGYNAVVPAPARKGIKNALENISEPTTFANEILQGKPVAAAETVARFVINTTVGIGGLWNPAEKMGLKRNSEDFGQTLAVWGIKNPPYYVMPFVGPQTTRDAFGFMTEVFLDPTNMIINSQGGVEWIYMRLGANVLTTRASLDQLLDDLYTEKDPYLMARSAYLQRRAYVIRDGKDAPQDNVEDDLFFDDLDEEEQETVKLILKASKARQK